MQTKAPIKEPDMENTQQKKKKYNPIVGGLVMLFVCVGFGFLWSFTSFPTNIISTVSILLGLYIFQRIYVAIRWEQQYGIPYSQRHNYQQILLKKQELKAQKLKEKELLAQRLKEEESQNADPPKKKKSHRNDYRKNRKKPLLNGDVAASGAPTADFSNGNIVADSVDGGDNNFLDTLFNVDGNIDVDSSSSFFIFDAISDGGGDGGDFGGCDGGGGDGGGGGD